MHFQRFQLILVVLIALLSATNSFAQQRSAAPRSSSAQQQVLPDAFGTWHSTGCDANAQRPAISQEAGERQVRECQVTSRKLNATNLGRQYRQPSSAYEGYNFLLRSTL